MPEAKRSGGENVSDRGLNFGLIAPIWSQRVHRSQQFRQIVIICDFVHQGGHIVPAEDVEVLISEDSERGVNLFTKPIVLADKKSVEGNEDNIFVDPSIT